MAVVPESPIPQGFRDVDSHAVTMQFSSAGNGGSKIIKYSIRYAKNLNFTGAQTIPDIEPGTATSYRITGLDRQTRYYFQIRAWNVIGWGDYGRITFADTLADFPGPPNPWQLLTLDPSTLNYKFNPPTDSGGLPLLEHQVGFGVDPDNVQQVVSWASGDTYLRGLSRKTMYYVWSRARNARGWGPWSARFNAETSAYVPAAPTPLGIAENGQTSLHYVFRGEDDGGAPIQEWQVGYSTDPNNVQAYLGYQGGDVYINGLQPATTYYVWARGRNESGWSPWSARSAVRTIAGARVVVWGQWHEAIPYVNVNGVWRLAQPYAKSVGLWNRAV